MKRYLDIDGVIVDHDGGLPLLYVREFLECVYEISNGEVFWLSTLKEKSFSHVVDGLQPIMDDNLYNLLKKIKPSPWNNNKTEVINV